MCEILRYARDEVSTPRSFYFTIILCEVQNEVLQTTFKAKSSEAHTLVSDLKSEGGQNSPKGYLEAE